MYSRSIGDPEFNNDTYTGKQNQHKPKSEEEYVSIDAKVVMSLMDNYPTITLVDSFNAKISISKYNNSFQRILKADGCDVQLIGTDTDSGIYVVTKLASSYEENLKHGERIDTPVHQPTYE